ncbi:S41 family peptidase [Myroides sp. LJL119]
MIKNTLTLMALSLTFATYAQSQVKFMSNPSLSPDGKTAYFSFDGDIYQAPLDTGVATRLTALQGEETNPRVSPDGKYLAFNSNQFGNNDIFVMPLNSGQIKQLTFHQANDQLESWSWDNKTIYYTSNSDKNFASYKVDKDGSTPVALFDNYFNNTNALVETPNQNFLFTNSSESANQIARKRYKGENNPDIHQYNPETQEFETLTNYDGKDFSPTVDRNGNIYFISDQENGHYNLYSFENGKKVALTHFDTSIKKPFVSADGSKVIFEKDYDLFIFDTNSRTTTPLTIELNKQTNIDKEQSYNTNNNISYFDVSQDDKKIAFVSRGVLFVSDTKGKFIKQITDGSQRVMEVKWLKDNQTLLFSQTYQGYQNWFKLDLVKDSEITQLTKDLRNNRDITLNHDLSQAVYLSGRDQVVLMDLNNFNPEVIVNDEIWAFQNSKPSFSPDGKYVLFTAKRNFEEDIFVYDIQNKKTVNLTNTGVAESNPVFSPDGKYIYFTSDRINPSYPLGMQNPNIYRFSVDWLTKDFRSNKYDELFEKQESQTDKVNKKSKNTVVNKPQEIQTININTDGILERIELVSDRFGNQSSPVVFQDKEKQIVFYISNQDNGKYALYKKTYQDFEQAKTQKAFDSSMYNIIRVNENLYGLNGKNIFKFDLKDGKPEEIKIEHEFSKSLQQEFDQMYFETWAGVEENFYDENFHGIDWQQMKTHFAQYLPYVNNRADLRILLNDMLGELGSSHLGFNSNGQEEKTRLNYITVETGIVFDKDNPYKVDYIIRKSPAFATDIDIQKNDVLTKVNGQEIDIQKNREQYFSFPSKQAEISLTFLRNNKEFTVKLHPINFVENKALLYDQWIYENRKRVNDLSNNRIAYSYMKNMSGEQLDSFLLDMVEQEHRKEAVILDLRFNTGGNVHDKVLNFLAQRPYLQWKYREGALTVQSNFAPSGKPIVLLINEFSLSDAEMTAQGFKALKLGTIIGQETYRWIIFTSAKSLVDGSSYRLPAWGTYTLEGENLEKTGVSPDIYIKNTFMDRLNNNDPQLDAAVNHILKQLD